MDVLSFCLLVFESFQNPESETYALDFLFVMLLTYSVSTHTTDIRDVTFRGHPPRHTPDQPPQTPSPDTSQTSPPTSVRHPPAVHRLR